MSKSSDNNISSLLARTPPLPSCSLKRIIIIMTYMHGLSSLARLGADSNKASKGTSWPSINIMALYTHRHLPTMPLNFHDDILNFQVKDKEPLRSKI